MDSKNINKNKNTKSLFLDYRHNEGIKKITLPPTCVHFGKSSMRNYPSYVCTLSIDNAKKKKKMKETTTMVGEQTN